jgi:hypothetical protein
MTSYLANNGNSVTCSGVTSTLTNALKDCANSGGINVCNLPAADRTRLLSNAGGDALRTDGSVPSIIRNAFAGCPASTYSEVRMQFATTATNLQSLRNTILAKICSILNLSSCDTVTLYVLNPSKRQGTTTAVVGISGGGNVDASSQANTVVTQQAQVQSAAGVPVTATPCGGQCSSAASLAVSIGLLLAVLLFAF